MAFVQRKDVHQDFLRKKSQNVNQSVNIKRQKIDALIDVSNSEQTKNSIKTNETSTKIDGLITENNQAAKKTFEKPSIDVTIQTEYKKVYCHWLDSFKFDLEFREHKENFSRPLTTYGNDLLQVLWVSRRYYCIVRCLLLLNERKKVLWEDLAEITNALIYICGARDFIFLPPSYPYTTEIIKLKDKLKALCESTEGEEEIFFCLDMSTRYLLLIQKHEMSSFEKITFSQLLKSMETGSW